MNLKLPKIFFGGFLYLPLVCFLKWCVSL